VGKYNNDEKIEARDWVKDTYRKHFGYSIPESRHYLSLCNTQPRTDSEISQYVNSELITPNQFYGVDLQSKVISENRQWWPEARWYNGDWVVFLVTEFSNINPALIYLDTTSTPVSTKLIAMVIDTMHQCHENTMLCVNVMLNNPAYHDRKWDSSVFVDELSKKMTQCEHRRWFDTNFNYKPYCSHKTVMAQYVFTSD